MTSVAGLVCVVTGASSGLGRRFCLDLAGSGARVIGIARRAELLDNLERQMRDVSPESETAVCDVSDTTKFESVLRELQERLGRIDVLVNDAGVGELNSSDPDVNDARAVMETNFFAAVASTLTVLPGMLERRFGIVVNVSSDSARAPGPREITYAASKAALSAFTEALAYRTEGTGVCLHVLYPGWVPTAMGSGAVDAGMPLPPRSVRRTEGQVSQLLLSKIGGTSLDIDAAPVARMALVARGLFPKAFRRGVRKALVH